MPYLYSRDPSYEAKKDKTQITKPVDGKISLHLKMIIIYQEICNTIIYSCLCGSLQESVQEGNGENDI